MLTTDVTNWLIVLGLVALGTGVPIWLAWKDGLLTRPKPSKD